MSSQDPRIQRVVELIEVCPDFPKPGIIFRNIFPVLKNPSVFQGLIDVLVEEINAKWSDVDVIVGLDSRGFLFGPMIAQALGIAFIPVRKGGKLPGETTQVEYSLEYGKDAFEIQKNSVTPGQKVVIIDDLLATGGTMAAACELMGAANVTVLACIVVIELLDLKGRDKITYPLLSIVKAP